MVVVKISPVSTRERPVDRGVRRGRQLTARLINELRTERITADLSQAAMAGHLDWSKARYWRFERGAEVLLGDVSQVDAVLALELSVGLHRTGDAIVDSGHQALLARFRSLLSSQVRVTAEVPLP